MRFCDEVAPRRSVIISGSSVGIEMKKLRGFVR